MRYKEKIQYTIDTFKRLNVTLDLNEVFIETIGKLESRIEKLEGCKETELVAGEMHSTCTKAEREFLDELKENGRVDSVGDLKIRYNSLTSYLIQRLFKTNFKDVLQK